MAWQIAAPMVPDRVGIRLTGQDQAEFVAAQARDLDRIPERRRQAAADLHQQRVTGQMAVDVVDRLEAVEVDEPEGEALAGRRRGIDHGLEIREEAAPVGQTRERVDVRDPLVLAAQRDEMFLGMNEVAKILVVNEQDENHDDGDEAEVEPDRGQHRIAHGQEYCRERHRHDDGQKERRRAQVHQAEDAADHRDRHEERDVGLRIGVAIRDERQGPCRKQDAQDRRGADDVAQDADELSIRQRVDCDPSPLDGAEQADRNEDRRQTQGQGGWSTAVMRERECDRIHTEDAVQ